MEIKGKHFVLSSAENVSLDCVILARKKNLTSKPPYYIWDLTRGCYVSSLKPTDKQNTYNFDIRQKGEITTFYSLSIADNGKIEITKL